MTKTLKPADTALSKVYVNQSSFTDGGIYLIDKQDGATIILDRAQQVALIRYLVNRL